MHDYAGYDVRSDRILRAGLHYLGLLRDRSQSELGASNAHELCRVLEVLEMMETARIVFITSINRRESRGLFKRQDYPEQDHRLDHKYQTIEEVDGKIIVDFRDRR